eukprot:CAMPEP_0177639174 /NCGR_PEP_ID=MMETSP0447-20121125/5882_1 /TAXON_ID=0 /ORGANISM="Stygamoeba regulata, Strain BSH-02190019" /LENGTH=920 /DNA_ID=CAMNT_0019141187 /DNA_START=149 /DNA_END=2911 /DNA_ORIENTATION=+
MGNENSTPSSSPSNTSRGGPTSPAGSSAAAVNNAELRRQGSSEREIREREIKMMDADMRRKLGRAQSLNMRVIIRGARQSGKSSLFRLLEDKPFVAEYHPTPAIDATQVNWIYKMRDLAAKLELWDIVDRAKDAPQDPNSLSGSLPALPDLSATQPSAMPSGAHRLSQLDARLVDVYKGAHAVVFMHDPCKLTSFEYVRKHAPLVPRHCGILICSNFRDREKNRIHSTQDVRKFTAQLCAQGFMASSLECSMQNSFGLDGIRAFLNLVLLNLQRQHLEAQLTANRSEMKLAREELQLISAEQSYESFEKRLAEMRMNKGKRSAPPPQQHPRATPPKPTRSSSPAPTPTDTAQKPSQRSNNKESGLRVMHRTSPQPPRRNANAPGPTSTKSGASDELEAPAAPQQSLDAFLDDVSDSDDGGFGDWSDDEEGNSLVTQDRDVTPNIKRARPGVTSASIAAAKANNNAAKAQQTSTAPALVVAKHPAPQQKASPSAVKTQSTAQPSSSSISSSMSMSEPSPTSTSTSTKHPESNPSSIPRRTSFKETSLLKQADEDLDLDAFDPSQTGDEDQADSGFWDDESDVDKNQRSADTVPLIRANERSTSLGSQRKSSASASKESPSAKDALLGDDASDEDGFQDEQDEEEASSPFVLADGQLDLEQKDTMSTIPPPVKAASPQIFKSSTPPEEDPLASFNPGAEEDADPLASFAPDVDDDNDPFASFTPDTATSGFEMGGFSDDDSDTPVSTAVSFADDDEDVAPVNPFVTADADFGEDSTPKPSTKVVPQMPPSPAVPRIRARAVIRETPKVNPDVEKKLSQDDALAALLAQAAASLQAEVQATTQQRAPTHLAQPAAIAGKKPRRPSSQEKPHRSRRHRSHRERGDEEKRQEGSGDGEEPTAHSSHRRHHRHHRRHRDRAGEANE